MKARFAGSMMSLDESMGNVVEFADRAAMLAYLKEMFGCWSPMDENVTHQPYTIDGSPDGDCFDARIGWHTWLVCIDGKAAMFTDGGFGRCTCHDVENEYSTGAYAASATCPQHGTK
jgi:hypothetical protein